jgi:glycosyltransferase involved in cell wall biosynthesis
MPTALVVEAFPAGRAGGGSVASLVLLQALRRTGWDVDLVLNFGGPDLVIDPEVRALCREIVHVPRRRSGLNLRAPRLTCLLRHGYWPRHREDLWDAVRGRLRSGACDLLVLDHLLTAECGRLAKDDGFDLPVVLRAHNVESTLQRRGLGFVRGPTALFEGLAHLRRWRAIESNLARYCDLALAISAVDAAELSAMSPGFPVEVLPAAIDLDHYLPGAALAEGKELVFVGGCHWPPNLDAVRWLVREIFPAVGARPPGPPQTNRGERPPAWLGNEPQVTATGFVADERPFVARARVVLAPIRFGSGVRIKILSALAMGKAVVSTRLGAEGIPVEHGHSVLLADTADAFAEAVATLLVDDAAVARLGRNGRKACVAGFDPEPIARRLDALLRACLDGEADALVRVPAV